MKRRRKICSDFLSLIDSTGELLALLDDSTDDQIKQDRKIRAELMTRHMDAKQYLQYCEARQASFTPRYKIQKFRDWLLSDLAMDVKLNTFALEILGYMAYETVAQIVDMALLVRRDRSAASDNSLSQEMAPVAYSYDHMAAGDTRCTHGMLLQQTAPTSTSPPVAPKLLCPDGPATLSVKKKLSKPGQPSGTDILTAKAIQPSDIHEALRRYCQPIGPFSDFSKMPLLSTSDYLLCL
jgi:transcription initiation protein SPT3